jgi:acyl-[acyl-carrier-protein]-phospholipid O-acyltransferase/long-chain-fatty-acid--[acyl-carrier-protein] ligase
MASTNQAEGRLSGSFWALNISQFLGALNDNAFRLVMALALVAKASDPRLGPDGMDYTPIMIGGVVFAIPYILFSSAAGVLADRFSKRKMIVLCNFCEVLVMVLGLFAFLADNPVYLYIVLFLMAAQSAFFSPNKLGILPEIVPRERLSYANGLFESFTYIAIILGTVGGSWVLYENFGAPEKQPFAETVSCWRASVVCIALGATGFLVSLLVKDTGARASGKKPTPWFWADVYRNLRSCGGDRYLLLTIFAVGFFLFLGSIIQINVTPYGVDILEMKKAAAANLFLFTAFGIGAGSFLAGRLSGRVVEIGLVPLGSAIVSTALILFILPVANPWFAISLLFLMGMGGGFYIVPLHAFLQARAPEENRGELIATANFFSFCGVALASGFLYLLDDLKITPDMRFFIVGLLTLGLTVYVVRLLPDFCLRFIGLIITRLIYRLETVKIENVPMEGGALLVSNHISYIDAPLLGSTQQRRIRYVMSREHFGNPRFNWFFRLMRVIPISDSDPPKQIGRALKQARAAMDEGYLVCIFAEGTLTRTGFTNEFKRGFERILKGSDHPVIPVAIHGIWDSMFSFYDGAPLKRWPKLRKRVTVVFGDPLPASTEAFAIRQKVLELLSGQVERDKSRRRPLPQEFVSAARSSWGRPCMSDSLGKRLTFGGALTAALATAGALAAELKGRRCVGLLLPTSVGGALANLAVMFLGKIPVNLNYTASREAVLSAVEQCGIQRVVTSRAFLEKAGIEALPKSIFLEDVAAGISGKAKLAAFLQARFWPADWLVQRDDAPRPESELLRGEGLDAPATIIFSSGSTGKPKGVVLSHYNIYSNVRAVQDVVRMSREDVMCGVLPFFHSFGFTATLWLPLLGKFAAAYHPNPIEAARVGQLVEEEKCTFLLATPTFLLMYIRKIKPEQFASLRLLVTGAEKLKPRISEAFKKRFGVEPFEGYGTTELSPVVSLNMFDVNMGNQTLGDVVQQANKPGTIGRPIPGVVAKIIDPDDPSRDLGYDHEGLLLVKGPNVMRGYLGQPGKTAEVLRDGWYSTGDIARIDHEGFITITDRLSRFSKIGGEMVPHLAVEEALQKALGATQQVCAVTALPDERKGEKIVVLLTPAAGDPAEAHRLLKESDLPNLWRPAPANYKTIETIPLLGSGKMDLGALKEMAKG